MILDSDHLWHQYDLLNFMFATIEHIISTDLFSAGTGNQLTGWALFLRLNDIAIILFIFLNLI